MRLGSLRIVIYANDHRPAHVHVIGHGEAVFLLNCPDGPAILRGNYGFGAGDIARIASDLGLIIPELCRHWSNIHGRY